MKQHVGTTTITIALVLSWGALAVGSVPPVFAEEEGPRRLLTSYALLVGFPDLAETSRGSVLIVPGTVIPDTGDPEKLDKQLKDAYRLEGIVRKSDYMRRMNVGEATRMPSSEPGIDIRVTLVGFNEAVATYRVELTHDGQLLADTPVSVRRGGRAVVGSRNGEAAPYVFLVVGAPDEKADGEAFAKPQVIERVNPHYPESARKAGIQGTVLLETLVSPDGSCRVIDVLESPDPLLTEAAREAVEQWRYEPARKPDGRPAEVQMTLTIRFRLD
jgi:TonB family protein